MKTDNVRMMPRAKVIKVLDAGGKLKLYPDKHQVILNNADGAYVGEVSVGTFLNLAEDIMYSGEYDIVQAITISRSAVSEVE